MALALSTSWNAHRFNNAKGMLFEIEKLGFTELELSFNLTSSMVLEIGKLAKQTGFKIASVHNFSPIPDELPRDRALPDCYSMSSLDKEERRLALKYTKRTIDTASFLGAKVVVLHCGRVEMQDQTRKLIALYDRDCLGTDEFREIKEEFIRDRASISQPFFANALDSLRELSQYALEKSINLGVENRFYYREIPSFDEISLILSEFKDSNVFYWHDFGHAQLMEKLGFNLHRDYLDSYKDALVGVHLHNIIGCLDHQAPFIGELDFSDFKQYLKKDTLKVIEAHHPAKADDIKQSKALLERLFDGIL